MPLLRTQGRTGVQHYILREGVNVFGSVLQRLESKVTPTCIKRVDGSNYTELSKQLKVKPMFSRYYLVYANVSESDQSYFDFLNTLALSGWVQLILTVRSKAILDEVQCHRYFDDFKVLDCYNVTIDVMDKYIYDTLIQNGCDPRYVTQAAVTRIRRRAKYKAYVLDSVLPLLAQTNLSKKTVESYISPYTGVTLQNIGVQFFNPKKQDIVASYMLRYHKHITDIYKRVSAYVDSWLKLYEEYISGRLSDETVISWIDNYGKRYDIAYEYQAQKWLKSFSSVSYEFMITVFVMLQEYKNASNNLQLTALYKIFRMVSYLGQS